MSHEVCRYEQVGLQAKISENNRYQSPINLPKVFTTYFRRSFNRSILFQELHHVRPGSPQVFHRTTFRDYWCHPTNNVKALKEKVTESIGIDSISAILLAGIVNNTGFVKECFIESWFCTRRWEYKFGGRHLPRVGLSEYQLEWYICYSPTGRINSII